MTTFEERLEQGAASAWRVDEGDANPIVGVITNIDFGTSEYQGSYPIVTVQLEDGSEKAIHAFRTVLRNEFIKQQPQIGEKIGVKDLGEQPTKPGSKYKSYHGYVLKVDRASGSAFNWGRLTPEGEGAHPESFEPAAADMPTSPTDDDIPF